MDSQKWLVYRREKAFPLSLGYGLEGVKLSRVERRIALEFDCSTCATPAELESLHEIAPGAVGHWFPNGVDLELFRPGGEAYDPTQICFVGRMDYFPNEQAMTVFVREVFPLIREKRPQSKLVIVGASPTPKVRALAGAQGVSVTGSVPDVRPYLAGSACTVAPLYVARGTQNKILESLALGVPVVASTLAARGLDARVGEHLLAADSPRDVASAVLGLMNDRERRQRFAQAGRSRMESHHSWTGAMRKFDEIVERTMSAHQERCPSAAD
jgi:sugar transferase (PEP-CTERM/EpsH1 system associated)